MGKPAAIDDEAVAVVEELSAKLEVKRADLLSEDCAVAAAAMKEFIPLSVRLGNASDKLDAVSRGNVELVTWAKTYYIPRLQQVLNEVGAVIQQTKCKHDPDYKAAALEYTKSNTGEVPVKKPE